MEEGAKIEESCFMMTRQFSDVDMRIDLVENIFYVLYLVQYQSETTGKRHATAHLFNVVT